MSKLIRKKLRKIKYAKSNNNIFANGRNNFLITQNTQTSFINELLSENNFQDNHIPIHKTHEKLKPTTLLKANIYSHYEKNIIPNNVNTSTEYYKSNSIQPKKSNKENNIPRILKIADKNKNSLSSINVSNSKKTKDKFSVYQEYICRLNSIKNSINNRNKNYNECLKTKTHSISNHETNDDYLNQVLKQRKMLREQIINRHRSLHGSYPNRNFSKKKKLIHEQKGNFLGNLILIENQYIFPKKNNNSLFSNDILKEKLSNNKLWNKDNETKEEDNYKNNKIDYNKKNSKKYTPSYNFFGIKIH